MKNICDKFGVCYLVDEYNHFTDNHYHGYQDDYWFDDQGEYHRDNEPAIILRRYNNGRIEEIKKWYQHGEYHRVGGPAINWFDEDSAYYQNGILHRLDGPALDYVKFKEWWINGECIQCKDNEEFLRIVKMRSLL
jgi:hypothetical protein